MSRDIIKGDTEGTRLNLAIGIVSVQMCNTDKSLSFVLYALSIHQHRDGNSMFSAWFLIHQESCTKHRDGNSMFSAWFLMYQHARARTFIYVLLDIRNVLFLE